MLWLKSIWDLYNLLVVLFFLLFIFSSALFLLSSSSLISSLIFPSSSMLLSSSSNSIPLSNKHTFFFSLNNSFGVIFFSILYFLISLAIPFSYNSFICRYLSSLIFFSFSSFGFLLLLLLFSLILLLFFQMPFLTVFLCFSVFGKIGLLLDSLTVLENNLTSSNFGFFMLVSFPSFFSSKNKL